MTGIQFHFDIQELTSEINTLKMELTSLIVERDTILYYVIPSIFAEYQLKIGHKNFEASLLEYETNRLRRKLELIKILISNNKPFDEAEIDDRLNLELEEWQFQLIENFKELKKTLEYFKTSTMKPEEVRELKQLYSQLVFKYHPDLSYSQTEFDKQLWLKIIESYRSCDIASLKTLNSYSPGVFSNKQPCMDDLKEQLHNFKRKIMELLNDFRKIKTSFPYNIRFKLKDSNWVDLQLNNIALQINTLNTQKLNLESILKEYCL